jgi:hypothetical protein
MKLQNFTNVALQQQELESIKGGKRVACITPQKQQLLAAAVQVTLPKGTICTTSSQMIGNTNIMIEWRSTPCKKP